MRSLRFLFLLACLPLCVTACHDDGLGLPGAGDVDMAGPPIVQACSQHVDRASCLADSACEAPGCPGCDGAMGYAGCFARGTGPWLGCPAIACAKDCSVHTDQSSCDSDSLCTSVYADPGTCDCAGIGCCMQFTRCDQAPVQCSPTAAGPLCEGGIPSDCGPGYAPIFDGGCPIGCVLYHVCFRGT